MHKLMPLPPQTSADNSSEESYLDELDAVLQETVEILANVDGAYARRRVEIDHCAMSQSARMRLLAEVDDLQRRDREPWVLKLAELYREVGWMMFPPTLH